MKHTITIALKVLLPILLGSAILWWMYRGEDWEQIIHSMTHDMRWEWMLLSFPFGILAQTFRAWRWQMALEPVGEHPRTSTTIYSIFVSYAVSLVIPRSGEFARCGVLKRYDNVNFSTAVGTVVTERAIDTALMLCLTLLTLLLQVSTFMTFFEHTGTTVESFLSRFSLTGYLVTAVCGIAVLILAYFVLRKLALYQRVKDTVQNIWDGIRSALHVRRPWLFLAYSVAIWLCYFLHYYLTFYCFDFTENLGITCALVTFVVGTIAVIVPTPNGAGPWHFAVKTMLILYGVTDANALVFVLIVHTVQTLLVVGLGIYAWAALALQSRAIDN